MLMKHLSLLLLGLFLGGCANARQSTPNAEGPSGVFHQASQHEVSTAEYRVDPPDEIIVKSPMIKELDQQKQKVRPDGKISLNLLGEVYVAGLTPTQINDLLRKLTEKYYANPDIKVEVIANSKFFYVFGFGVAKQGKYAWTGQNSVVSALAEAGFGPGAWPQQVYVSRPGKEGQANATAVVDFKKIWGYGDLNQNYLLHEGDIIEVPYSPLAAWNEKMTRIMSPLMATSSLAITAAAVGGGGNSSSN